MRYRRGRIIVVGLVTTHAGRAGQVVVVVDVAVGAGTWWHCVRARQRETCAGVVEGCVHPVGGVVTTIASLREIRRNVIRTRRSLIVLKVATHAGGAVEAVVVVHVTICASSRRYGVQAGQREACAVVIEGRVHPVRGVVAGIAGLREIRCHVVGTGGALEILQVAGYAGSACQIVITVDMAIGAGTRWHGMQAGKRKACGGVIERGIQPRACAMALLASLGEIRCDVIGIRGALEVL